MIPERLRENYKFQNRRGLGFWLSVFGYALAKNAGFLGLGEEPVHIRPPFLHDGSEYNPGHRQSVRLFKTVA